VVEPGQRQRASEAEYLAREQTSSTKHEYINGEIVAMSGATPEHNLVAMTLAAALVERLRDRPCLVLSSDQRVHVRATKLRCYPDVTVVCGPIERDAIDSMAIVNPVVIVEVLSETTEAYDRGAKFAPYRHLSTLMEYVLVSPADRRVEHYRRLESAQWLLSEVTAPEASLTLPALDLAVPLSEIFAKLDLLG
jgi:Uma2 family endonuclease